MESWPQATECSEASHLGTANCQARTWLNDYTGLGSTSAWILEKLHMFPVQMSAIAQAALPRPVSSSLLGSLA